MRPYLDALEPTQAAEKGKTKFKPSAGQGATLTETSSTAYSGTVLIPDTWDLRECPDTTGLLNHHTFTIGSGLGAIYAEVEWQLEASLLYLVVYGPDCAVLGESAALLHFGAVFYRAIAVTNPAPGTYTVAVYGRINPPTPYTGAFSTFVKN